MKRTISTIVTALALITLAQAAQAQTQIIVTRKAYASPFYKYADPYTGELMTVYRPDYLVPSNDFEGGRYPGAYAVNRAIGKCVTDLGYGRYEHC